MNDIIFKISEEGFKKVVERFQRKYEISSVVNDTVIAQDDMSWQCYYKLRGGFGIDIELVDTSVYKNNQFYCDLSNLLSAKDYEKYVLNKE